MQAPGGEHQPVLRLGVAQLAPRPCDVAGNAALIAAAVLAAGADLLVTPELSLTGYDIGDAVHRLAWPAHPGAPAHAALPRTAACDVIIGTVEADTGGPFNAGIVVRDGAVAFRHRKIYLPTYGMFDEGRWFGRGDTMATFRSGGWHCGLLICEDFWHPGLVYVLAARGIEVLLVQAAAPGRGVWRGGEHGSFASADIWDRMVRTTAQLYGIYVVLANRVGVEGGVTFAGGSVVVAPDGEVLARAGEAEALLSVELSRDELARARQPYAHARDDSTDLVLRELARSTGGGG